MLLRSSVLAAAPVLACLAALPGAAQDHRELGAHQHGHGQLDIAREDDRLSIELEAPGADIVGFEHEAEADADRAAVAQARDVLSRPFDVLALPEAAGCKVLSARVALETGDHHDDEDHPHDADHEHEHEHEAEHEHEHEHEHEDADHAQGHAEFHASWELICADPDAIDRIGFPYFQLFAGAQALAVRIVSDQGAQAFEVERAEPVLDLDGAL